MRSNGADGDQRKEPSPSRRVTICLGGGGIKARKMGKPTPQLSHPQLVQVPAHPVHEVQEHVVSPMISYQARRMLKFWFVLAGLVSRLSLSG